ncbi:MAG: hypothetical protein IKB74_06470, partial [Lentisphaeria bacterium]|nr:hypothetical protein [Lentisphaeria bacterium]
MKQFAQSLQKDLEQHFSAVRISCIQTQEQLLNEIRAINPDKLPAVIIVFDDMLLSSQEGIKEYHFTLVVVSRFVAASSEKALTAFSCVDTLLELFPADG